MVLKRPKAEQSLIDHFVYIGQRNSAAAEAISGCCQKAFGRLARFPLMGRAWLSSSPRLVGVRSWTIPKFKNYRIFYRPIEAGGIEVLHVFHGARDIANLLESEEEENA